MEIALGIVATLLVGVVGWMLSHSAKCSAMHERVAKLEEWQREREKREAPR
jgi:hypothetical protein